jgi:GNAT superfamily N-acetyltransferase
MNHILEKYDLVEPEETIVTLPSIPKDGLIAIVGTSGSGKSTILKHQLGFEGHHHIIWRGPLLSLFSTPEKGEELLIACGLRSIPTWKRPFSTLSNGERHRAEIALGIDSGFNVIDEFTSVVDRVTAKSLSVALSKYYRRSTLDRLVVATCHKDILEWLQPDHIYDTDLREWLPRGSLRQRPKIKLNISPCEPKKVWEIFRKHHYLNSKMNKSCNAFVATHEGEAVAMTSVIAYPNGNFKNAWREHRTVVLPEWQGLGIGNKLSDTIAKHIVSSGCRFFSKTSHPAMGEHRNKSPNWKATSKNGKKRDDYKADRKTKEDGHKMAHAHRVCYSHEFIK